MRLALILAAALALAACAQTGPATGTDTAPQWRPPPGTPYVDGRVYRGQINP